MIRDIVAGSPGFDEGPGMAEIVKHEHAAWMLNASRIAVVVALVPATLIGLFTGRSAIPLVAVLLAATVYHVATLRTPLGPGKPRGIRVGLLVDLITWALLFYFTGGMLSPLTAFAWIWAMAGTLLLRGVWRWIYVAALAAAGVLTTPSLHVVDYAPFNLNDPGIVISGATAIATAAGLAYYVMHRLRQMRDDLVRQTMHDPLTGLLNRRAFDRRITELCGSGAAARPAFSLAVVDLDHFKALNDSAGHDAGDQALIAFARLMSTHVRPEDGVYRIGGEEFAVIFPATALREAQAVMNRARGVVTSGTGGTLTFSAGVASGTDPSVVLAADHAMYRAKQAGRDNVQVAALSEQRSFGGGSSSAGSL
jgi:diguanylate cyclase (GGDEF)-like protein